MAYGENIGQPWLHKGVKCAKCDVTPISGYRYKCKKRPDYDLCQACFRREIPDPKIKYLKIERAKTTGPYQVHFIECVECGVAPIKGKRYRHKSQVDWDLCEACFLRATNPSNRRAQPESDYELFEELVINSVCTKYNQVFHFDKRCDECLVSPICGPTFTSIKNPDYDLCAFCHDDKLQHDSIKSGDFVSREKPEVNAIYHLNIICCVHCGMTPVKGPAFKHRRDPNKTLCLVCYHKVQEEKQRYYTRIDPPRQADKGGFNFTPKIKTSAKGRASATKTPIQKTSTETPVTDAASNLSETNAGSDSAPTQGANSISSSTTTPDTNEGGMASRGYGGRSNVKSNGTNSTITSSSNDEGGAASRGYGGRSNLKSNGTSNFNEDGGVASRGYGGRTNLKSNTANSTTGSNSNDEGGVPSRGYGGRSNIKSNGTNSTTNPDSNEEEVASRGYGARSNFNSNGTTPVAPGLTSPKITSRTVVEIKAPPPLLYTAGLRTSRAPSPRRKSPPSPEPGQPQVQQSGLKFTPSTPAAPKSILKVSFAEPEQQPPPGVKFSPSLQPPHTKQAEVIESSPPQSQQRVCPPPPAQNSIPQFQQRGFAQPTAAQQQAVPGSHSVYPPSSQSQAVAAMPPPQASNYMPGAPPNFPATAADYLAAMTAAQNSSAQQALAMLSAIRIEKERSNLALLQQILQRTQGQQGVDYSTLLGNTGGGVDYSAILNNGGVAADYLAPQAPAAGGGMDLTALLAAAGGGNADLAALLAGQNNLGGLASAINNNNLG